MNLTIETKPTILSGLCRVRKTQKFLTETNNFADIDLFLDKLFGAVVKNFEKIKQMAGGAKSQQFKVETEDKQHMFFLFVDFVSCDIVFVKYRGKERFVRANDRSLFVYLKQASFVVSVNCISEKPNSTELLKLYRLSNSPKLNFPLLNQKQKSIVAIEDSNVLVQGVAGSGKTNLCVDKLIFAAARGYRGKILYTTYSRGLLTDTQEKLKHIENTLTDFLREYKNGNVVFLDNRFELAIENRFGIHLGAESISALAEKLESIAGVLRNNVEFLLLEDIFRKHFSNFRVVSGEDWFEKIFLKELKNHQLLARLRQASNLSHEVIYKEIFGVLLGCADPEKNQMMMSLDEFVERRKDSFSRSECELMFWLAKDYLSFLEKTNSVDNNLICKKLLRVLGRVQNYSLVVVDEVQDFTELNLYFLKQISQKMFCVGDALQMINPSYFSFAYLKRLMFKQDEANVVELKSNYRSTKKIAELIGELGQINIKMFGTHSFVLDTVGIDSDTPTELVFLRGGNFAEKLQGEIFNNYTIIVGSAEEKQSLKNRLKKQEILTVSEVKGLERNVVVLYNVLSKNIDKFNELQRISLNRKKSDENSVFRYYFNLFYVGISRGKSHIFVYEDKQVPLFEEFLNKNFKRLELQQAMAVLTSTSDKTEALQDELIVRIEEFLNRGQFGNARFTAEKILNEKEQSSIFAKIDVFEKFVSIGNYRAAGIAFWEAGLIDDAKKYFELSGDSQLLKLLEAVSGSGATELGLDILDFLPDLQANSVALELITNVLKKDFDKLAEQQKNISQKLKQQRQGWRKNG